jgi:hypothetical protein
VETAAAEEPERRSISVEVGARAAATVQVDAVVIRAPPPDIPEIEPAALDFAFARGRLAVARTPSPAASPGEPLVALLHEVLGEFFEGVRRHPTNGATRLIERLGRLRALLPAGQLERSHVFRLAHEADVIRSMLADLEDGELDAEPRAEAGQIVARLDDIANLDPAWLALKRNAAAGALSDEQIAAAPELARTFLASMATNEGQQALDASVPDTLGGMVDAFEATPNTPAAREARARAATDIIAFVGNMVKRVAGFVHDIYGAAFIDGFQGKWFKGAKSDGARVAVWLRGAIATGAGWVFWTGVAAVFPTMGPLVPIVSFVGGAVEVLRLTLANRDE